MVSRRMPLVTRPTPVRMAKHAARPVSAVRTAGTSLLTVVLVCALVCWAMWTYLVPGPVKTVVGWGIRHIDTTCAATPAQLPADARTGGLPGLTYSLGAGARKVADWKPDPAQVQAAVVTAATEIGKALGAFQAGANGAPAPTVPAGRPTPDVTATSSTACCGATLTRTGGDTASQVGIVHARAAVTDGALHGAELVRLVAEGIAEDATGDPTAVNPRAVNGSTASGLWQLMLPLHRDLLAGQDWRDPVVNAHAAALLYRQQGWGAWNDSHPGAWLTHQTEAEAAIAIAESSGTMTAACSNSSGTRSASLDTTGVVGIARRYLGTPYVWGGDRPGAFDCSGLTQYVWARAGIAIPRTAEQQRQWATPVGAGELQPGDLVFFQSRDSSGRLQDAHHVGLWVGDGQMIDAPHAGSVVRQEQVWGGEVISYGRVTGSGATT